MPQPGGDWQVEAEGVAFQVGASSLTADVDGTRVELPFETAITQQVQHLRLCHVLQAPELLVSRRCRRPWLLSARGLAAFTCWSSNMHARRQGTQRL